MKKIISVFVILALALSMTAFAFAAEAPTCEDGCTHEHEAITTSLEYECSSHNIMVESCKDFLYATATGHYFNSYVREYCANANCDWEQRYGEKTVVEGHIGRSGDYCIYCGLMIP